LGKEKTPLVAIAHSRLASIVLILEESASTKGNSMKKK
jgi:hypothetical protein